MRYLWIASSVACSLLVFSACSPKPGAPAVADAPAAAAGALKPPPAHETVAGGTTAEGTVVETMDAANYTYARVKTAAGEVWAASAKFKVAVGDTIVVPLENPMTNFHSQSLNRDFPLIYFAQRILHPGESEATAGAMAPQAPTDTAPVSVTEPIAPAPGGVTVTDVITKRKALAGKTVVVRGKVVKFNGGIMELNWLHIQDGSGSVKDGTNDIAVTSANGAARVGDIVTVTGTVVVDKDFGAGYRYDVLLQNATIAGGR